MPLNVFITGGTGFLGQRVVAALLREDVRIHCLVRPGSAVAALTESLPKESADRVRFISGDLMDTQALTEHLAGMDVVYHLAASLSGSPSTMFLNTVIPTRRLMEAAVAAQVSRFVLISSMGVYGTQFVRRWGSLDESTPVDPHPEQRDPYTFSKVRQESIAWEMHDKYGLPLVVVRPGVIYGPGRSLLTSRVGLSLGPLLLRMGGGQPLPYTYVENCAEAVVRAGLEPGVDSEVINVVDDNLPTGKRIVKLLRQHGQRIRSLWIPRGLIAPLSAVYHCYSRWTEGQLPPVLTRYKSNAIWKPLRYANDKARRKLNWSPRISTEEGLRKTIAG